MLLLADDVRAISFVKQTQTFSMAIRMLTSDLPDYFIHIHLTCLEGLFAFVHLPSFLISTKRTRFRFNCRPNRQSTHAQNTRHHHDKVTTTFKSKKLTKIRCCSPFACIEIRAVLASQMGSSVRDCVNSGVCSKKAFIPFANMS